MARPRSPALCGLGRRLGVLERAARGAGSGHLIGVLGALDTIGIPTHFCAAVAPPPIADTYSAWLAKSVVPSGLVTVTNTGWVTLNSTACGVSTTVVPSAARITALVMLVPS